MNTTYGSRRLWQAVIVLGVLLALMALGLVGTVDDSDVVVYQVTLAGATWAMALDGSQVGLTTAAEDVDGLEPAADGEFILSTTGNFSVPGHYGNTISGGDETLLRLVGNSFHVQYDALSAGLAANNDVSSLAYESIGDN